VVGALDVPPRQLGQLVIELEHYTATGDGRLSYDSGPCVSCVWQRQAHVTVGVGDRAGSDSTPYFVWANHHDEVGCPSPGHPVGHLELLDCGQTWVTGVIAE
jgi:hypothetical protein